MSRTLPAPPPVHLSAEESCTNKQLRVEYLAGRISAGEVIQAPERRRLAGIWGIGTKSMRDYIYEAARMAGSTIPREVWAEKLNAVLTDSIEAAYEIEDSASRAHALRSVVEVAGKFTGSAAPDRVQIEQVTIQVAAELNRYLQALATRLPEESYRVCLQVAEEMRGG